MGLFKGKIPLITKVCAFCGVKGVTTQNAQTLHIQINEPFLFACKLCERLACSKCINSTPIYSSDVTLCKECDKARMGGYISDINWCSVSELSQIIGAAIYDIPLDVNSSLIVHSATEILKCLDVKTLRRADIIHSVYDDILCSNRHDLLDNVRILLSSYTMFISMVNDSTTEEEQGCLQDAHIKKIKNEFNRVYSLLFTRKIDIPPCKTLDEAKTKINALIERTKTVNRNEFGEPAGISSQVGMFMPLASGDCYRQGQLRRSIQDNCLLASEVKEILEGTTIKINIKKSISSDYNLNALFLDGDITEKEFNGRILGES